MRAADRPGPRPHGQLLRAIAAAGLLVAMPLKATEPPANPAAAPAIRTVGWPAGSVPRAPLNFRVTLYARGLDGPRALLVLPNGDVLAAESRGGAGETRPSADRVRLLRDTDGDGVADEDFELVSGVVRPTALALRRDRLYIGTPDAIISCPFLVGQTRVHGDCHALADLPFASARARYTRALAFSLDEARLLVGIGAASGEASAAERADPERGTLLALRADGRERRIYATEFGDPTAIAIEPASGMPFVTDAARPGVDGRALADALVGAPAAGARVARTEFELPAHGAARSLVFYGRAHFPKNLRGSAFVALGGGADGLGDGYRVIAVPFKDGRPAGPPEDFLTGFVKDAANGEVYGRPAGLAVATDGTLLLADDGGNVIWRVTFKCAACTPDPPPAPAARQRRPPARH